MNTHKELSETAAMLVSIEHAYQEAGEGPSTILLLHCSASSGAQWNALTERLAQQHRVLTPDLCGHGDSAAWSGHTAYRLEYEVSALAQLLAEQAGPVHLVGHSYGGALALMLALRAPQRLRSLSLIEPIAPFVLRPDNAAERCQLEQLQHLAQTVQTAMLNGDDWAGMAYFINYWNGEGAWEQLCEQQQFEYAQRIRSISLHFQATFNAQVEPCELRELRTPTLVLRGGRSPAPAQCIAAKLASMLPSVHYQIIPNAGHMAPLTHSGAVNAVIDAHIKAHTPFSSWRAAAEWFNQDILSVWADCAAA